MASAETKSTVKVDVQITLTLTLREAKALQEITGYGADRFLEGYKKHLGSSYIEPHERGVRELFGTIGKSLSSEIRKGQAYTDAVYEVVKAENAANNS